MAASAAHAGTRIREQRRRRHMSQRALASAAGISASYLNLIEHDRRPAGGRVLSAIARALTVSPAQLSGAADAALLAELREAAAAAPDLADTALPPEQLLAQAPGWARMLARSERRIRDQQAVIAALSDRLTHDPFLQESVHGMLSSLTSIRSTAAILNQVPDISHDQRRRFYRNLHEDSLRLSQVAEALAAYLARAAAPEEGPVTPQEALDGFLADRGFVFDDIDAAAAAPDPGTAQAGTEAALARILAANPVVAGGTARALAEEHLRRYAEDARAMPLAEFAAAAREATYDPARLAQRFGQSLHAVFRRLAVLRRPRIEAPAFGLIVAAASGYPLVRQPLPGFPLPRHGNACLRWPLFASLGQPGVPIVRRIDHDNGGAFVALAVTLRDNGPAFGTPGGLTAAMLMVAEDDNPFPLPPEPPEPVGTSCRICSRSTCDRRSEPALTA